MHVLDLEVLDMYVKLTMAKSPLLILIQAVTLLSSTLEELIFQQCYICMCVFLFLSRNSTNKWFLVA